MRLTWYLPPALGTHADLQRASWLVRRCGLAASAVRGAVHGGHSWFHHYSVFFRNSIFRVQYLAHVIYSSLYLGTPASAYRFLVCYIQSIVVDVLSSYRHIDSFRGMGLYRAIFVMYAHDRIMHDNLCTTHKVRCSNRTSSHLGMLLYWTATSKGQKWCTCNRFNDTIRAVTIYWKKSTIEGLHIFSKRQFCPLRSHSYIYPYQGSLTSPPMTYERSRAPLTEDTLQVIACRATTTTP